MALNLMNAVADFLQKNPRKKFTAQQIADEIFKAYPEECRQKQKRSKAIRTPINDEKALLSQLRSEIASQRPRLQKRHPEIKVMGSPMEYYYTESADSTEKEHTESNKAFASSKKKRIDDE